MSRVIVGYCLLAADCRNYIFRSVSGNYLYNNFGSNFVGEGTDAHCHNKRRGLNLAVGKFHCRVIDFWSSKFGRKVYAFACAGIVAVYDFPLNIRNAVKKLGFVCPFVNFDFVGGDCQNKFRNFGFVGNSLCNDVIFADSFCRYADVTVCVNRYACRAVLCHFVSNLVVGSVVGLNLCGDFERAFALLVGCACVVEYNRTYSHKTFKLEHFDLQFRVGVCLVHTVFDYKRAFLSLDCVGDNKLLRGFACGSGKAYPTV